MKTLLSIFTLALVASLTPACIVAPEDEQEMADVEEIDVEETSEGAMAFAPTGEGEADEDECDDCDLPPIVLYPRPRPGLPILVDVVEAPQPLRGSTPSR